MQMYINAHYERKIDEQEKSYTNFKNSNIVTGHNQ